MTAVPDRSPTATTTSRRSVLSAAWPAALAVLVTAATAYGLSDPRQVAPVVAASGLVYLAAAILNRPNAAWVAFAVTFVLIGLSKVVAFDPAPWLIGLAALLLVIALIRTPRGPSWATPLQSAAMLALAASAAFAVQLDATMGGIVVAITLLGHAAWDVHHHHTRRVVSRSLAEFCAVLDVLLAILVAVVSVAATA